MKGVGERSDGVHSVYLWGILLLMYQEEMVVTYQFNKKSLLQPSHTQLPLFIYLLNFAIYY